MRETSLHLAIIAFVAATVFFLNLGQARLWDRDEPRNAGCAAEMLQRGDYVVPIFNDQLRHQKPILQYWLILSAYQVFGVNEFAARFWSAVLGMGTLLATYSIGRHLFDAKTGLMGAVALGSSLMFAVAARAATPDSVLMFCVTTALALYVASVRNTPSSANASSRFFPTDYRWVAAIYLMLGLAVLSKGPVGFLLPMATIGLFGLIDQRQPIAVASGNKLSAGLKRLWAVIRPAHFAKTLWQMRPLSAAVIVLLVAAPWYVLVHLRTEGDFTRLFFVGEHFGRATSALENHSGGIWYYPIAILLGFFPWSCLWGPTLISIISFQRRKTKVNPGLSNPTPASHRGITLLICWIVIQVGAFSIAQTKLPSYVTPCYPALALLTAWALRPFWLASSDPGHSSYMIHRGWHLAAFAALAGSGVAVTIGLWLAMREYLPNLELLAGLGLIPLAGGLVLLWLMLSGRSKHLGTVYAATAVAFVASVLGLGTVAVDGCRASDRVLDPIRQSADVPVAAYGCLESSWVFYGQHPIVELTQQTNGTLKSSRDPTPRRSRPRDWKPLARETPADFGSRPNALILTTDEHLATLLDRLPPGFEIQASAPYFLKKERTLYLLSKTNRIAGQNEAGTSAESNQNLIQR